MFKSKAKKALIKRVANHPQTHCYENNNGSWHLDLNIDIKDAEQIKLIREILSKNQY